MEEQTQKQNDIIGFIRFAIGVIIVVVLFRTFIAQPFVVSGESMAPTFANANYLIVDQVSYSFGEPERGDVVIFRPPLEKRTYYIKRVIGVPGDTITANQGTLTITNETHPEGFILEEPYVAYNTDESYTIHVEDGTYFVLGDNRANSFDSRRWGLLPEDNLTGKALIRLFPLSDFSLHPGAHMY